MTCSPTPDSGRKLVAEIAAKSTGELFLYVNDAVLMVPNRANLFYKNNTGTATVTLERTIQ
jgi:hypothetical protein